MNNETLIRRAEKWQSEVNEALVWAEETKNHEVRDVLRSQKSHITSLLQILKKRPLSSQAEFWIANSPASAEINSILERIVNKISKLTLPAVSSRSKEDTPFARSGN